MGDKNEFGLHSKKLFWLGHNLGHGLNGARRSKSGPREKNPINNRAGSGSRVQTRR